LDVMEAIFERRSIRDFRDQPIREDQVERMVEAASFAPSAHNGQPWEFIYVDDKEKLEIMHEGRRYANMLLQAPGAFVVCARFPDKAKAAADQRVRYMCIQDTAAAVQNLLLAAHAMGLGACWIGDFDEAVLCQLFAIPQGYAPVAVIAVGYPKYTPEARPRRPVSDILHWGRF